jgi:hypothetical protein
MAAPVGACLFAFFVLALGTTGASSSIKSDKLASFLHAFLFFLPIGFMRDT